MNLHLMFALVSVEWELYKMSNISEALEKKREQLHQMDYNWRVILPSLGYDGFFDSSGAADANTGFDAMHTLQNAAKWSDITHRVYEVELPEYSYETRKNQLGTGSWYGAESRTIGTISLTVDEMEDGQTLKYFDDWKSLIRNSDGTYNPPVMYKRAFVHYQTAAIGLDLTSTVYTGCFPSDIQPVSWNYDSNGVRQYRITLACDKVQHGYIPAEVVKVKIAEKQLKLLTSVGGVNMSTIDNLGDISGNVFGAFGL